MNTTDTIESAGTTVSRRDFLKTTGAGLTFAVVFGPLGVSVTNARARPEVTDRAFSAWVVINTDNTVLIYNPSSEMGQGSGTAVPIILAEELDVDWSTVRLEFSPTEPEIFGSGPGNAMVAGGSRTVRTYFTKVRNVGAQIRRVLLENAARHWDVPITELTTEPSLVVHAASGRRLTYGEIAAFAEVPDVLPSVPPSQLKPVHEFRLIGAEIPRYEIPGKVDGSLKFSIDVHVPGMLYGVINRTPTHGGRPESFNADEVAALSGITRVVALDHGVGIIGETLEGVLSARKVLEVQWAEGAGAAGFDSEATLADYARIAESPEVQTRTVHEQGDAGAALESAVRQYEADYYADHVYHAQLEPVNAIASVNAAGDAAEVWAGTQVPWSARQAAGRALGVGPEKIMLHRHYSGGGFGRRLNPDYIAEAVYLSNAVKRPVKLLWTREDDLQYGFFRPMNLQRFTAGVNAEGDLVSWKYCVVGDDRPGMIAGGSEIPFYDVPNQYIEARHVESNVRHYYWRGVAHPFNKHAIEAFIDEIAAGEAKDPIAYRRKLMRGSPRALKLVDTVVRMAERAGSAPEGRARGFSFGDRGPSMAAAMVEISLEDGGEIRVHRAWIAGDFGIIVQPDNARAQMEGGFIFGLSSVLKERVTFINGQVQQSNFRDYPLLTMAETPEIEVEFVLSYENPVGIGELSNPLPGGAVANAFRALTGKSLRHAPFTPDRVLAVLGRA